MQLDVRAPGQAPLLAALAQHRPDLVITTVHRILAEPVTSRYQGRLINLHYSLLPAFGGAIGIRPVRDALAYGSRFTGVTVHRVDATSAASEEALLLKQRLCLFSRPVSGFPALQDEAFWHALRGAAAPTPA